MSDFSHLKAGEKVIVASKWNGESVQIIEKITPKGYIKVNGTLYDKYGSAKTSDAWNRNTIFEATPERIKNINEQKFINRVFKKIRDCKSLTYEQAVKIDKILNGSDNID